MKFFVTLIISFLIYAGIQAQVSGRVVLDNSKDYSGIKVKFVATASPFFSDSTLTKTNGDYSIHIAAGSYNIWFSKASYQSLIYNRSYIVGTSTVLANNSVLGTATLFPGSVVNVSGFVSGNWSSNNIYLVNNDITIPANNTLTIEPGTVIKFNGNYKFNVFGKLSAEGTSDRKIRITSNYGWAYNSDWTGITIRSSSSVIKNCIIEYAYFPINIENCSPDIIGNYIQKFHDIGIQVTKSSSLIKNNVISDYKIKYHTSAITVDFSNCIIECNTISDGTGYGIRPFCNCEVRNNVIHHINDSQRGYGIQMGTGSATKVENNIIHDCNYGIDIGGSIPPAPTPLILNNTIFNNFIGIAHSAFFAKGKLINNNVVNNSFGIALIADTLSDPSVISHNNCWNNSNGNYGNTSISGLGQIIGNNANGHSEDIYHNISENPRFVDTIGPFLANNSPCFFAGNALFSNHIGANTDLFCYGMVLGVPIHPTDKSKAHLIFPNPFVSEITITNIQGINHSNIRLYDIIGKLYETRISISDEKTAIIYVDYAPPGIYFLEINFPDGNKKIVRLIKEDNR